MTRQSKLTTDQPKITVEYPPDVDQVTVKVTTGQGSEPISKKLDLNQGQQDGGQQKPDQGGNNQQNPDQGQGQNQKPDQGQQQPEDQQQIQVEAKQDENDPHLITLKAIKFPEGVDKLIIDWGVQQVGNTPKELTKEKPEVSVKFSPKTQRVTVTVDDENNPETQPWTKAFKIAGGQGEQGQQPSGGQSGGSSGGSGQGNGQSSGGSGGSSGGSGGSQSNGGKGGSSGQGGQSGGQAESGSSGGSQ